MGPVVRAPRLFPGRNGRSPANAGYYDQVVGRMCIAGGDCRPATRVEQLPPVYGFQRDRRALSTETTSQLLRLLPEIRAEGVRKVLVRGHTNEMNPAYNINFSLIMANAVADFLIKNGVPADKVTTRSWGAPRPLKEKAILTINAPKLNLNETDGVSPRSRTRVFA